MAFAAAAAVLLLPGWSIRAECRPQWSNSQTVPATWGPLGLADLNGDGIADLVNVNSSQILVSLTNPSTRSFGAFTIAATGTALTQEWTGDIDGDDDTDLLTLSVSQSAPAILVYPGQGNGTFAAVVASPTPTPLPEFLVADFDGDLDADIAFPGTNVLEVWLNDGAGHFSAATSTILTFSLGRLAAADINGDGHQDVVARRSGSTSLIFLAGSGSGTFSAPVEIAGSYTPSGLALADLDDDGDVDITTTEYSTGTFSVLLNGGPGTFGTPVHYSAGYDTNGTGSYEILLADVSGDGVPDATMVAGLMIATLIGNGDGSFASPTFEQGWQGPRDLSLSDITGDGRLDLIYRTGKVDQVAVLATNNCGDLTLLPEVESPLVTAGSHVVVRVNTDVPGFGSVTGPVTIYEGEALLATGTAKPYSSPPIELPILPAGVHTLRAVVAATSTHREASAEFTATVTTDTTTTTLSTEDGLTTYPHGKAVELHASVTATNGEVSEGTYRFFVDGTPQPDRTQGFMTVWPDIGSHHYQVQFLGSDTQPGSMSNTLAITIERAPSHISRVSTASPSKWGESLLFELSVDRAGTLNFYDGGALLGSADVTSHETVSFTPTLAIGTHSLKARYEGTELYLPAEIVFEHTVLPDLPFILDARSDGTSVTVNWYRGSGAYRYVLFRLAGGTWQSVLDRDAYLGTNYVEPAPQPGTAYVYRVNAYGVNAVYLDRSNIDATTVGPWTDDPLAPGVTRVKAAHFTEIVSRLNQFRAAAGLAPLTFPSLAAGGMITRQDLLALRSAVNNARLSLGLDAYPFPDTITAGVTAIRVLHVQELRAALR